MGVCMCVVCVFVFVEGELVCPYMCVRMCVLRESWWPQPEPTFLQTTLTLTLTLAPTLTNPNRNPNSNPYQPRPAPSNRAVSAQCGDEAFGCHRPTVHVGVLCSDHTGD